MITMTDSARQMLDNHFKGKDRETLRVYLSAGGCSGPKLSLALDEAKDGDEQFDVEGYQFVIEKELLKAAAPLTIDGGCCGFTIASSLKLGGGCGGGCSCS